MDLLLSRFKSDIYGVHGLLYLLDSVFSSKSPICCTLEPSKDSALLFGSGFCIEEGSYSLEITYSPKFRKPLPLIKHPLRQGIRIHAGNSASDTSGCVLVGCLALKDSIRYSNLALKHVISIIKTCSISKIIIQNEILPF